MCAGNNTTRLLSLIALSLFAASCSDKDVTVNTPPVNPNVTVAVSPKTRTVQAGDTISFSAAIGGSTNSKVEWTVFSQAPAFGFISQNGLYKAPATISDDSIVVYVEATSVANPMKADTARIIIKPSLSHTMPKSGSTFSYTTYETDSAGAKVPGSDKTAEARVVGAGLTYKGKSDVMAVSWGTGIDTAYYQFDVNGDFWRAMTGEFAKVDWLKYPFASQTSSPVVTDEYTNAEGVHYTRTVTMTHNGQETMTIGGGSMTVYKLRERAVETKNGVQGYASTTETDYWFSPSIGWFVRIDETTHYTDASTNRVSGTSRTLTTYSIK